MKSKYVFVFVVFLMFLSFFSSKVWANTYQYVDTAGKLLTVEAVDETQALTTAPNIDSHSGVMLVILPKQGGINSIISNTSVKLFPQVTYQYISVNGSIQSVIAETSDQAFIYAPNISPTSGVIRVEPYQRGLL